MRGLVRAAVLLRRARRGACAAVPHTLAPSLSLSAAGTPCRNDLDLQGQGHEQRWFDPHADAAAGAEARRAGVGVVDFRATRIEKKCSILARWARRQEDRSLMHPAPAPAGRTDPSRQGHRRSCAVEGRSDRQRPQGGWSLTLVNAPLAAALGGCADRGTHRGPRYQTRRRARHWRPWSRGHALIGRRVADNEKRLAASAHDFDSVCSAKFLGDRCGSHRSSSRRFTWRAHAFRSGPSRSGPSRSGRWQ